jgi:hypothetical protein
MLPTMASIARRSTRLLIRPLLRRRSRQREAPGQVLFSGMMSPQSNRDA